MKVSAIKKRMREQRELFLREEMKTSKNVFLEALIAEIAPTSTRKQAIEMIAKGLYVVTSDFRRKFKCGARLRGTDKTCRGQALANGRCEKHGGRHRTSKVSTETNEFRDVPRMGGSARSGQKKHV